MVHEGKGRLVRDCTTSAIRVGAAKILDSNTNGNAALDADGRRSASRYVVGHSFEKGPSI